MGQIQHLLPAIAPQPDSDQAARSICVGKRGLLDVVRQAADRLEQAKEASVQSTQRSEGSLVVSREAACGSSAEPDRGEKA